MNRFIGGPTASGKTALAVELALREPGTALLNADSRQLNAACRIAAFTPTPEELRGVLTYLFADEAPGEGSVARYAERARSVLAHLAADNRPVTVVGGTGLFIRTLRDGYAYPGEPEGEDRAAFDMRWADPKERHRILGMLDAIPAAERAGIDRDNPRRVRRALERRNAHHTAGASPLSRPLSWPLYCLWLPTPLLSQRIAARVSWLFSASGLAHEVESALARGIPEDSISRSGIGYREALSWVGGSMTRDEAAASTLSRTLRYAKAQRTWFRHEKGVIWLDGRESAPTLAGIIEYRESIARRLLEGY